MLAMAMVKFMRTTISPSNPLINFKSTPFQNQCRYDSDGCGQNPNQPTLYDSRKFGHRLSCDDVTPDFEIIRGIPSGVFRCTTGEVLGFGACKGGYYQNPEYFSFHHMTFYDFHLHLRKYRKLCPDSERKPP